MGRAAEVLREVKTVARKRSGVRSGSGKTIPMKLQGVLTIAEERGLLAGTRTHIVRGRMPAGLVAEAKLRSGITSESKLLEAALANLALEDDYGEWLVSQSGTVDPDLDLEF